MESKRRVPRLSERLTRLLLGLAGTAFGIALAFALAGPGPSVRAQSPTRQFELGLPPSLVSGALGSMRGLRVPQPQDNGSGGDALSTYIASVPAAVALGKALFWEQAIGSDGIACASCHFLAGADNRAKNALDPDLRGAPPPQVGWSPMPTGNPGGPNYTLTLDDFPFHRLSNPLDRNSDVLFDSPDVVSSQGVFATKFVSSTLRKPLDSCSPVEDPNFIVASVQTRRVEPRNTPTAIGAAFNFRNFWDGRANNRFNGVNPFGRRDGTAGVWKADKSAKLTLVKVDLSNSSLASQAVGPPGSDFEMSCGGRSFAQIGHKVVNMHPLANQIVDATDSVLAPYRSSNGYGLNGTYAALITAAFQPAYWSSSRLVVLNPANPTTTTFTQMEANFSLFFGLAIQEYEKTLIPDHTRWDAFVDSPLVQNAIAQAKATSQPIDLSPCLPTDPARVGPCGLTYPELRGLAIFEGDGIDAKRVFAPVGHCSSCHDGPEFSHAATHQQAMFAIGGNVERMTMGNFDIALYDSGFYNIGVTPTSRDLGIGAQDPWGNPLSFVGEAKNVLEASGQYLELQQPVQPARRNPRPHHRRVRELRGARVDLEHVPRRGRRLVQGPDAAEHRPDGALFPQREPRDAGAGRRVL